MSRRRSCPSRRMPRRSCRMSRVSPRRSFASLRASFTSLRMSLRSARACKLLAPYCALSCRSSFLSPAMSRRSPRMSRVPAWRSFTSLRMSRRVVPYVAGIVSHVLWSGRCRAALRPCAGREQYSDRHTGETVSQKSSGSHGLCSLSSLLEIFVYVTRRMHALKEPVRGTKVAKTREVFFLADTGPRAGNRLLKALACMEKQTIPHRTRAFS